MADVSIAMGGDWTPPTTSRLPFIQRLAYGAGDFGINIYFQMSLFFLLYFYTDVLQIAAAGAAAILFIGRVLDACADPFLGALMDRTRTRWGKSRPWLLFGSLPMAGIAIATFTVPPLNGSALFFYALVLHIVWSLAFSVIGIPYISLTALMTRDARERTVLSSFRMIGAYAAKLMVSGGVLALVALFPAERNGFQAVMIGYSLLATICLLATFVCTREQPLDGREPSIGLLDGVKSLRHNQPFWVIVGVFVLTMLALTARSAATVYYFKYVLERIDLLPSFTLMLTLLMAGATLATPWLVGRFGKRDTMIWALWLQAAAYAALSLVPATAVPLVFAVSAPLALAGGVSAVLGWAMIADTVEFGAWRTGIAAEGAVYSVTKFLYQLAGAVGGLAAALTLDQVGYVSGAAQSDGAKRGILLIFAGLPAATSIVAALLLRAYHLTEARHGTIVAALAERQV